MRIRGSGSGSFGIFGKIFRDRLAEAQPIGNGGILDGLDDDAAEAERLQRQLKRDNEAYARALAASQNYTMYTSTTYYHPQPEPPTEPEVAPVDNVVPFRRAQ